MTRKNASWSSGGWHTKTTWQSFPIGVDAGALGSHDKWSGVTQDEMEKKFPTQCINWFFWQKTRGVPGSKVVRKAQKENLISCLWRANWSLVKNLTNKPGHNEERIRTSP